MLPIEEANTTEAVQRYLGDLAEAHPDCPADPIIRALLGRSASRLHLICASFLHRSYPRLTRPPLNLQAEELLSALVERLLKSLNKSRPGNVRQFFGLVNQHMRWELNDLARHLDESASSIPLLDSFAIEPQNSDSQLSQNERRMLEAIESLPDEEKEVFSLVKIQGMSHLEAADLLDVSTKTVQRRMNRSVSLLAKRLNDLRPNGCPEGDDSLGGS